MQRIHTLEAARVLIESGESLEDIVFQNLDLRAYAQVWSERSTRGAVFLGCELEPESFANLVQRGAMVFPALKHTPWQTYRAELYTTNELFDGFDYNDPCTYCDTYDARVWQHWSENGRAHPTSLLETLARRLHDHAIYEAMMLLLSTQKRVVAIMGGHSMGRDESVYADVALMSKKLAEKNFFIASGGGPGAMEAAHLGVWFAGKPQHELEDAISMLADAPLYTDKAFLSQAFRVRARFDYAQTCPKSLGVPTWLYGHEPPNPFASHIAKFFANSVREDGLISIASHGIVFAPGSAGTIQEIFQDAAQNHYGTVKGMASPMVLLGTEYWTQTRPVYDLLCTLSAGRIYGEMLMIGDDIDALITFFETHPPCEVPDGGWSVCGAHCADRDLS